MHILRKERFTFGKLNFDIFLPFILFLFFYSITWHKLIFENLLPADGNSLLLFYPMREQVKSIIFSGEFPLWNHLKNMGEPLLADPQAMVLYPPFLVSLPFSFLTFVKFWTFFHSALSFYFVYKISKRFHGSNYFVSSIVAVFFIINPLFISKATLPVYLGTLSWLPACIYFLIVRYFWGLYISISLMWLSGFPPYFIICVFLMVCLCGMYGREHIKVLINSLIMALITCSVQIIPFLEMLKESARSLFLNKSEALIYSSSLNTLLTQLIIPPWIKSPDFLGNDPTVLSFYFGIPVILPIINLFRLRGKNTFILMFLFCLCIFLSLGQSNIIYEFLPFINIFRFPAHWLVPALIIGLMLYLIALGKIDNWIFKGMLIIILFFDLIGLTISKKTFAWVSPLYFTDQTPMVDFIKTKYQGTRIYNTEKFIAYLSNSKLSSMEDYIYLKESMVRSFPTAFGIAEAASKQVLVNKRNLLWRKKIEDVEDKNELMDEAGISVVIGSNGTYRKRWIIENSDPKPIVYSENKNVQIFVKKKSNNSLELDVLGKHADTLVFREIYYPGWEVYVDGKKCPIKEYKNIFMSFNVPSGNHSLKIVYHPLSLKLGILISFISLMFCLLNIKRIFANLSKFKYLLF